jgi:hypothetical protein
MFLALNVLPSQGCFFWLEPREHSVLKVPRPLLMGLPHTFLWGDSVGRPIFGNVPGGCELRPDRYMVLRFCQRRDDG